MIMMVKIKMYLTVMFKAFMSTRRLMTSRLLLDRLSDLVLELQIKLLQSSLFTSKGDIINRFNYQDTILYLFKCALAVLLVKCLIWWLIPPSYLRTIVRLNNLSLFLPSSCSV